MGTAGPISPVLPLDSSGRIAAPLPCVHCQQVLLGVQPEERCPECGKPASDSTRADRLAFADVHGLRRVHRGIMLLLLLASLYVLWHMGEYVWTGYSLRPTPPALLSDMLRPVLYLVYDLARGYPVGSYPVLRLGGLVGFGLACTLILISAAKVGVDARAAWLARAAILAIGVHFLLICTLELGWRRSTYHDSGQMNSWMGSLLFLAGSVLSLSYVAGLADRLPSRSCGVGLRCVRNVLPALLVALPRISGTNSVSSWHRAYGNGFVQLLGEWAPPWRTRAEDAVAMLALLFMLALLALLCLFARRLHQTIRLARVIRAAAVRDMSDENGP